MTELDAAIAALVARCRKISANVSGRKVNSTSPQDMRRMLAGLDGCLARIDAAEKLEGQG